MKKQINEAYYSLCTMLSRVLRIKIEVSNTKYLRAMSQYFYRNDWGYEHSLTYVKAFKQGDQTIVEIETHRPGLIIGKAGIFIDGLKADMQEETGEQIRIDLKECKMWLHLYS